MIAPPQFSPDGLWWWDGVAWRPIPAPPVGRQRTQNGDDSLGIFSLVASLLGFSFVPVLGSLVGVVLGHVASARSHRAGQKASTVAVFGLVLGYIGVVVGVVLSVFLFWFIALLVQAG